MSKYIVSASPHITKPGNTTQRIMLDVIIALCPCVIAAVYFYGYHVLINLVVCMLFCAVSELLFRMVRQRRFDLWALKKSSIFDLSSTVTAIILALNLPSVMVVRAWDLNITNSAGAVLLSFDTIILCALASIFAIVIVKMMFGGLGANFANPAATGRIFLFLAVGLAATQAAAPGLAATTGATWLSAGTPQPTNGMLLDMLIGNTGAAAVGEACAIAILVGYAYLSWRRVIDWRIPAVIIASAAVFALLFSGLAHQSLSGVALLRDTAGHILSGGLLFGAVFMATDYATSPNTFVGNVIFGVGIALLTMLIRVFASYPEGMSFAIVLMNILTPVIDKYIIPRPFGAVSKTKQEVAKS